MVPARVALVLALALGLCAMHVFAAAVSQQHAVVHGSTGSSMAAMTHAHPGSPTTPGEAGATPTRALGQTSDQTSGQTTGHVRVQTAVDHEHHHAMGDCVLFLSAGIALVALLLVWVTARALRPSYWLLQSWLRKITATTPWRGPPPWHWPRISLCVIRV